MTIYWKSVVDFQKLVADLRKNARGTRKHIAGTLRGLLETCCETTEPHAAYFNVFHHNGAKDEKLREFTVRSKGRRRCCNFLEGTRCNLRGRGKV